jgi:6-phosphogluconolactonase
LKEVESCNREGRSISVAFSGGRIARDFFDAVAVNAQTIGAALGHTHFFWADERCVPPDHPDSNYLLASRHLFMPLGITGDLIYRIKGELPPEEAADEASRNLSRMALKNPEGVPILDYVFLGMGEDGHVASLFPDEAPEARQDPSFYRPVTAPKPPPSRVTIGYGVIAAAKQVWVLASGAGKEAALAASLGGPRTPLGLVLASRAATRVFTDIAVWPK